MHCKLKAANVMPVVLGFNAPEYVYQISNIDTILNKGGGVKRLKLGLDF